MKPVSIAPAYVAFYPMLTEIAREKGYALAVHGSVLTDMDLIAIPWSVNAKPIEALVEAISDYASKVMVLMFKDPVTIHGPEQKAHGRVAYSIQIGNGYVIDLSIIKPLAKPVPDFDSLDETQKQKLAIMLLHGTEQQQQEAMAIVMSNLK